jgi:hypothetical protein
MKMIDTITVVVLFVQNYHGFFKISLFMQQLLRKCKIDWDKLLMASILVILKSYGITQGVLALYDTDNKRCKKTTKIGSAHKVKDKGTGGYFNGQEILFLVLITNKVTIPVGYKFYMPLLTPT